MNYKQTICFIGACDAAPPKEALRGQVRILKYLTDNVKYMNEIYAQVICPYMMQYWKQTLDHSPYYFSNPAIVREEVKDDFSVNSIQSVKKVLRRLATALNAKLNEEATPWLKE